MNSSLRFGIVLQGGAPFPHSRIRREINVAETGNANPGPEREVGNGGTVKSNKARSALLLLAQLILKHLIKTRGFALESGEGRLLRLLSVRTLPVVIQKVDVALDEKRQKNRVTTESAIHSI